MIGTDIVQHLSSVCSLGENKVVEETMIVNFSKEDVWNIIKDETIVYTQIPFIYQDYFDFESDSQHLLSMEIEKSRVIGSDTYFEGYYPFYRQRDFNRFKELLSDVVSNEIMC